jgi:hypothetical protein
MINHEVSTHVCTDAKNVLVCIRKVQLQVHTLLKEALYSRTATYIPCMQGHQRNKLCLLKEYNHKNIFSEQFQKVGEPVAYM